MGWDDKARQRARAQRPPQTGCPIVRKGFVKETGRSRKSFRARPGARRGRRGQVFVHGVVTGEGAGDREAV